MTCVRTLLERASRTLAASVDEPKLESQILLAHVLGRERAWLYAWPEHIPDDVQVARFEELITQRALGHPVAHLVGRREFWSMTLSVDTHTLIPRPETELLVEAALQLDLPEDARVLDLGTGSGAIALALAGERPGWRIVALDRSIQALAVAQTNARSLGKSNIRFIAGHWYDALSPQSAFDLILSNPPYVAEGDPHLGLGDLRFEPAQALVSGTDGLDDIRQIVAAAPAHLRRGGWLWLEHGNDQGGPVVELLRRRGFEEVVLRRDLAGHERLSGGRCPGIGPMPGSG